MLRRYLRGEFGSTLGAPILFDGKNFREENAGATKQAAKDIVNRKSE